MDSAVTAHDSKYFGELAHGDSIEDRLNDVHGARRWQRIVQIYGTGEERTSLPFYAIKDQSKGSFIIEKDGKTIMNSSNLTPALHRSKHNTRRQDSVVRRYAQNITSDGIQQWCRGIPIATESEIPGHWDLLAAASMCEALYIAAEAIWGANTQLHTTAF